MMPKGCFHPLGTSNPQILDFLNGIPMQDVVVRNYLYRILIVEDFGKHPTIQMEAKRVVRCNKQIIAVCSLVKIQTASDVSILNKSSNNPIVFNEVVNIRCGGFNLLHINGLRLLNLLLDRLGRSKSALFISGLHGLNGIGHDISGIGIDLGSLGVLSDVDAHNVFLSDLKAYKNIYPNLSKTLDKLEPMCYHTIKEKPYNFSMIE